MNEICGTFDMKSNNVGPVIPKKLKNWIRGQLNGKNRISVNKSKLHRYGQIGERSLN